MLRIRADKWEEFKQNAEKLGFKKPNPMNSNGIYVTRWEIDEKLCLDVCVNENTFFNGKLDGDLSRQVYFYIFSEDENKEIEMGIDFVLSEGLDSIYELRDYLEIYEGEE